MHLTETFTTALAFTARLHATQVRKGSGVPYLAHLLAVAAIVLEYGGGETEATAALLHDALEDQGPRYPGGPDALRRKIAAQFGTAVLAIVEACTDAETIPKPPWRARKEAYIAHLQTAPAPALLVSAADKLHNARAILSDFYDVGDALWERFTGGKAGTLWYYRALVTAFRAQPDAPPMLIDALDRVVTEIETAVANP